MRGLGSGMRAISLLKEIESIDSPTGGGRIVYNAFHPDIKADQRGRNPLMDPVEQTRNAST